MTVFFSILHPLNFIVLWQHPGGVDAIADFAGKDGSKDFDDVGHSSDARKILAKYKVGEIIEVRCLKILLVDYNTLFQFWKRKLWKRFDEM